VDGELKLVTVMIFDNFSGNKQQLDPRDADSIGRKCFYLRLIR
jgi:hypothetical protein